MRTRRRIAIERIRRELVAGIVDRRTSRGQVEHAERAELGHDPLLALGVPEHGGPIEDPAEVGHHWPSITADRLRRRSRSA